MRQETTIEGVYQTSLRQIASERGTVLHMLRCDEMGFTQFGEIYFSEVPPGVRKAWKLHRCQTQNFVVPTGSIRVAIFDSRPQSSTYGNLAHFDLGRPDKYFRLTIPPMLHYGFECTGDSPALLANCADLPHDPNESEVVSEEAFLIAFPQPKKGTCFPVTQLRRK